MWWAPLVFQTQCTSASCLVHTPHFSTHACHENYHIYLKYFSFMIRCNLIRILNKKKVIFIQLQESPILPFCLLLLCRYSRGVIGVWKTMRWNLFEYKESNFNAKNGSTILHFLTVMAEGADPPSLYGQTDRNRPYFFDDFPYLIWRIFPLIFSFTYLVNTPLFFEG